MSSIKGRCDLWKKISKFLILKKKLITVINLELNSTFQFYAEYPSDKKPSSKS